MLAFSPGITDADERKVLSSYDWQLADMQGNRVDFNAFKGKKIVINFWATWCPPCVAEMPSMQALYDDYGDQVVFIFVTNEDKATVSTFLQKNDYTFPVYQPRSIAPAELQSKALPTTYLISEKGEIVIHKTGAADWNTEKVRGLLE